MTYAGYAPGHRIVDAKTPLERALMCVTSIEALDVLEKLIVNVSRAPRDEKFRRVKCSNATIRARIVDAPEVLAVMTALGWVHEVVEGEGAGLTLPMERMLTMREARVVDEARIQLRRRIEEETRAKIRAKALAADPERAALQAQLAADRAERKASEPVTRGSEAVPMGESRGITTARDVGASGSSGC